MIKAQKMSVDLRIVSAVLLALLVTSVVMWKPWVSSTKKTVSLSGDASLKAEPDEFQFNPTYQEKGSDRAGMQATLIDHVNAVVTKLKELGVKESDITLASSTYDNYWNDGTDQIVSNSLSITVNNKDLAQKVQDYLITTSPQGTLTPYPTFSEAKRKKVEAEVRTLAIEDAKDKAQATADELGMRVGKVVTVTDQSTGGVVMPMMSTSASGVLEDKATALTLPVLSGRQEVTYTVQVTYELK